MKRIIYEKELYRGPLILVNRSHPCPAYAPALSPVWEGYETIRLENRAALLLRACLEAVGAKGEIVPVSGWRSRAEQKQIWDDSLAQNGPEFTRRYVARPGSSEHETGLAIDLGRAAEKLDFIRPEFPDQGVCADFRRAAARYGFIERYRQNKEALTGISPEPWHFRYVGPPHACLIEKNGLCLEEYSEFLRRGPQEVPMPGGRLVRVFYLPCQGAATPLELAEECCQVSGDNDAGFIITVWGRSA